MWSDDYQNRHHKLKASCIEIPYTGNIWWKKILASYKVKAIGEGKFGE